MTPSLTRSLGAAVLASAVAVIPVPLVGGMGVLIQRDLGFGDAALGAAITAFFVAAAITAPLAGHLSEWIGPRVVAWLGLGCIMAALLGIGLAADTWLLLTVFLFLAGVGHASTLLAVGVLLTRSVGPRRQGISFGTTQASAPIASIVAGLAVPAVGLTLGWRVVFVACVSLGLVAAALVPAAQRRARTSERRARTPALRRALFTLALGMALASAGGNAAVVFLVPSSINAGLSTADAGVVLATASAVGLAVRVIAGWWSDRLGGTGIGLLASVIGVGAIGYLGLAASPQGWLLVVSSLLALGGGWGWPGLMLLAATRSNPSAPGAALGIVTFGGLSGAVVGPLAFGAVAETASYSLSWLLMGFLALASVVLALAGRRRLLVARN